MMNRIRWVWTLVFVAVFALAFQTVSSLGYCQEASKARLQLINGTDETVEVYWIKSQQDRVHQGSIEPGKNKVIHTTIGHRFAVTNRADREIGEIESRVRVQAFRIGGVPKFYTQRILANGFEIVASDVVNPYALKEAAYIIDGMLGNRPDVREAMIQSGSRLCILGWNEYTTDQPEWQWLAHEQNPEFLGILGRDYYDARARGMGGSQSDPYCSCGEENLLCYPGDPYSTENILIHELAHNIHLRGMVNVDPTFDRRVRAAYDQAVESGLWAGKYASVNHHEYFAEGVQSWFDNNRHDDHDHNHVDTRAELLEYDPRLAALCREVFGDTEFKYEKPQKRLVGHLEGYDPSSAPTFAWPERLKEAQSEILRKAQARSKAKP
jgi:hypothetical protein